MCESCVNHVIFFTATVFKEGIYLFFITFSNDDLTQKLTKHSLLSEAMAFHDICLVFLRFWKSISSLRSKLSSR